MKTLIAVLIALPEIIRLIESIQKRIDERAIERKVQDDLKAITKAFEERNADALREIFNS